MPRSSPRKTKHAQEMQPTSQKLDAIDQWLQKMLDRFPEKKNLTTSEIEDWHKDLSVYSLAAIDFAFEKHRINAIFFPLNGIIIDLCLSYDPPDVLVKTSEFCDAICRARHWKGYGKADMMWLFGKMEKVYAAGDEPNTEALMTELDVHRGGPPEWRK